MKDIVNKLECIVFAGIIPLRNEKKRRKEWGEGMLERKKPAGTYDVR